MNRTRPILTCLLLALALTTRGEKPSHIRGRSISPTQVPDTMRRFINRYFMSDSRFDYKQYKDTFYAYGRDGQYMLFTREGTVLGYHFHFMQPPGVLRDCLPATVNRYLKEHYPHCYPCAVLPRKEGYDVKLFGQHGGTLVFDAAGKLLSAEMDDDKTQ